MRKIDYLKQLMHQTKEHCEKTNRLRKKGNDKPKQLESSLSAITEEGDDIELPEVGDEIIASKEPERHAQKKNQPLSSARH